MKKRIRMLTAALCAAVLLCGFSATAYAGGGEDYPEETTPPEQTGGIEIGAPAKSDDFVGKGGATERANFGGSAAESSIAEFVPTWEGLDPAEPGEGFSDTGNLVTRDLLYDKHSNKQFITVQTSGGSTFYLVIDYDKPTDEDGEQYETYFLNMVDEADLLAALEAAGGEPPACTCTDKCAVGAIKTDCPVCSINMGECAGAAPEPEPEPTPEPEPEQPDQKGVAGSLILVLAIFAVGGGAGWYFKIYRPKHQQAAAPEEDYEEEMDAYNGFEDDGPPWAEDDPEPQEEDNA